jgi:hypothetical protein
MSTDQRRERLRVVRAEGRAAFTAGRHIQTNPYSRTADLGPWIDGYRAAQLEAQPKDPACNGCCPKCCQGNH